MLYQRLGLDFSYRNIAGNLGIDLSTVYRIVELREMWRRRNMKGAI